MSREVWRMNKKFDWPLHKPWFGYLYYDGVQLKCKLCYDESEGTFKPDCILCYGEGSISPRVEPPGYRGSEFPKWREEGGEFGWQLWETVSEGSPVTPVLDTAEELAEWLVENDTSITAGTTKEGWLKMFGVGFAVSMVYTPESGLISGVQAIVERETDAQS